MLVIKTSNIWNHLILPKFKDFKVCILRWKNLHPKVKGHLPIQKIIKTLVKALIKIKLISNKNRTIPV